MLANRSSDIKNLVEVYAFHQARCGTETGQEAAKLELEMHMKINSSQALLVENRWKEPKEESTVDFFYPNNLRRTDYSDNQRRADQWQYKNRRWEKHTSYGFKLRIACEQPTSPPTPLPTPTKSRVKLRRSYQLAPEFRLDLTYVTTITGDRREQDIELEVEFTSKEPTFTPDQANSFYQLIGEVLHVVQDSKFLYTQDERQEVINFYNLSRFNPPRNEPDRLVSEGLFQARNLHLPDLVMGGIIDGPGGLYYVTSKADGERKLLLGMEMGSRMTATGMKTKGRMTAWLIMPPYSFNKFIDDSPSTKPRPWLSYLIEHQAIIEGELIPKSQRLLGSSPIKEFWFMAFDLLRYSESTYLRSSSTPGKPSKEIFQLSWTERYKLIGNLAGQTGQDPDLMINAKHRVQLSGVEEFYRVMNLMIRTVDRDDPQGPISPAEAKSIGLPPEWGGYGYKTDGLIFMPDDMPYNQWTEGRYELSQADRVLTRLPDICKWKYDITIDFMVKPILSGMRPDRQQIYTLEPGSWDMTVSERLKLFEGDARNRHDGWVQSTELIASLAKDTVVEFRWDRPTAQFVPVKLRPDKPKPNSTWVVIDNWRLINRPITVQTLKGEDTMLLRQYHNAIKRYLLQNKGGSLLDIGTGRGGDIAKMANFQKILAVEPNMQNVEQLVSRLTAANISHLVMTPAELSSARVVEQRMLVLVTGGEDTQSIQLAADLLLGRGEQFNYISCMLSLSFFWRDQQLVQQLVNTIVANLRPDGSLLVLTVEGNLVKHWMSRNSPSALEPAVIVRSYNGHALTITIPDSIVVEQEEYPPRIDDLKLALREQWISQPIKEERSSQNRSLVPVTLGWADKPGLLLNQRERHYNRWFVSYVFSPVGGSIPYQVSSRSGLLLAHHPATDYWLLFSAFWDEYRHALLKAYSAEYQRGSYQQRISLVEQEHPEPAVEFYSLTNGQLALEEKEEGAERLVRLARDSEGYYYTMMKRDGDTLTTSWPNN